MLRRAGRSRMALRRLARGPLIAVLAVELAVVLVGGMAAAGGSVIKAMGRQSVTTVYSLRSGGMTRTYDEIVPVAPLPASAPIIVVLAGVNATRELEITRDVLVPYVNSGRAELVYPDGYDESWNAGGCCGAAAAKKVDDTGFLRALAARVDPGHRHPLDVVGYSNGGRMAYQMTCDAPGVFDQVAVVKADPDPGCTVRQPQSILQIASRDDNAVPYRPGVKGKEKPAATVQNSRLRAADQCPSRPVTSRPGTVRYWVWDNCLGGSRIGFAVWPEGGHGFPVATRTQPSGAETIWSFFHKQNHVSFR